jgi:hypothetical protein
MNNSMTDERQPSCIHNFHLGCCIAQTTIQILTIKVLFQLAHPTSYTPKALQTFSTLNHLVDYCCDLGLPTIRQNLTFKHPLTAFVDSCLSSREQQLKETRHHTDCARQRYIKTTKLGADIVLSFLEVWTCYWMTN